MFGLKFCIPQSAAIPRRATPEICRSVTAKQHLSYVSLQRFPLLLNQYEDRNTRNTTRNHSYHWLSPCQSLLLPSRLTPPRLLPSFSNSTFPRSSLRVCLMQKPTLWRFHATADDPSRIFSQPLDPSCRRQSIRKDFIISLPILIIYLLLYLLSLVLQNTQLGRHYLDTAARFWCYRRYEGFRNVAGLCSYVTSQFTHERLIPLVIHSLVLVGVASILGSIFNRRTFFAVYVLGGFLAAAADCAWARVTNPSRSLRTQAQLDKNLTSFRIVYEACVKLNEFNLISEYWTNPKDFAKSPLLNEFKRQAELIRQHLPFVRAWFRWNEPNWALSGSLVCLVSVATLIRPRTIINFWAVRPSFLLYKLTAYFFVFCVCMEFDPYHIQSYSACLGGNLAAVPVWFLWLRRGHIRTLASGLRAFDQLPKPPKRSLLESPVFLICFVITLGILVSIVEIIQKARDAKAARASDPQQQSDETGNNPSGNPKEDEASNNDTQEDNPTNQPVAGNDDKSLGNDED